MKFPKSIIKSNLCEKDLLMAQPLKNNQKKNIAKELYLHGDYTFEEVADKVGAARQTVARWAKDEGWRDIKASMTVGKDKLLKICLGIICKFILRNNAVVLVADVQLDLVLFDSDHGAFDNLPRSNGLKRLIE